MHVVLKSFIFRSLLKMFTLVETTILLRPVLMGVRDVAFPINFYNIMKLSMPLSNERIRYPDRTRGEKPRLCCMRTKKGHSLISAFVICSSDSVMVKYLTCRMAIF